MDTQVLNGVEIFLLPFPYREDMKKTKQTIRSFWYQRYLFYQNNGMASVFVSEDRSKKASYMLFFDKKILDGLDQGRNNNLPEYGNFQTAHCRKMRQLFRDFREKYGEEWPAISQKAFLNFFDQKITRNVSTHSLKAMWRDFYNGDETDASLEEDLQEDDH